MLRNFSSFLYFKLRLIAFIKKNRFFRYSCQYCISLMYEDKQIWWLGVGQLFIIFRNPSTSIVEDSYVISVKYYVFSLESRSYLSICFRECTILPFVFRNDLINTTFSNIYCVPSLIYILIITSQIRRFRQ